MVRTSVDDDAAEDGPVSTDPLRSAVGHDVGAVLDGPDQVAYHIYAATLESERPPHVEDAALSYLRCQRCCPL